MASAGARGLCGSAPTARARPQGWGWPRPPRAVSGQGGSGTAPTRPLEGSELIPPPKSPREGSELGTPTVRVGIWTHNSWPGSGRGFGAREALGHQKPKTGGGERTPQGEAAQKRWMPGLRGEPRPGGGEAPAPRVSSISAMPNSHRGSGVSPRRSPNTHPGGVSPRAPQELESLAPPFSEPVAYKDLCLACLSERSIKGTASQRGRCLPSIPTSIFLQ